MGKVCLRCNTRVQDDARFCPNCGQMAFRPLRPEEEFYAAQPMGTNPPMQGAPMQQGPILNGQPMAYQTPPVPTQPMAQKPKKQLQWWQILLIVIASLLVVFLLELVLNITMMKQVTKMMDKWGIQDRVEEILPEDFNHGTRPDGAETPIDGDLESMYGGNSTSNVPYTKGTIKNGVYVNEWANLRFPIGKEWREGTAEEYAAYATNDAVEVGFLAVNRKTGQQFLLTFTNLQMEPSVDNDSFLDVYLKNVIEGAKKALDDNGVQYSGGNGDPEIIAGKYYRSAYLSIEEDMTQSFYVRMLDGYVITFALTTVDEKPSDVLEQVQTAH